VSPYTYSIYGNTIYATVDRLTIDYRPQFTEVGMDELDDDLEYPLYFKEFIKRLVIMCLKGTLEMSEGLSYLRENLRTLTANRSFNRIELNGTWSEEL
jgi:hypothetical protein